VLTDQSTGQSKGVGFVLFSTREEAEYARQNTDGRPLVDAEGRPLAASAHQQAPLSVKFAEDNKNKMLASLSSFAAAAANMGGAYGVQAPPTTGPGGGAFGGGFK